MKYGRLFLLFVGMIVFGVLLYGRYRFISPQVKQLHFVVPDNYRGLFVIKRTPGSGLGYEQKGKVFIFRIPSSGILQIEGKNPGQDWHTMTAEYASGAALEAVNNPAPVKGAQRDNIVRLYPVDSSADGSAYYLVGTETELEYILRSSARSLGHVQVTQSTTPVVKTLRSRQ